MSNKDVLDDTKQSGFVSAIVLKFTKLIDNKEQKSRQRSSDGRGRKPTMDGNFFASKMQVFDSFKDQALASDQSSSNQNRNASYHYNASSTDSGSRYIPQSDATSTIKLSDSISVKTEMSVIGEVSVKDRIKAYMSITKALQDGSKATDIASFDKGPKKTRISASIQDRKASFEAILTTGGSSSSINKETTPENNRGIYQSPHNRKVQSPLPVSGVKSSGFFCATPEKKLTQPEAIEEAKSDDIEAALATPEGDKTFIKQQDDSDEDDRKEKQEKQEEEESSEESSRSSNGEVEKSLVYDMSNAGAGMFSYSSMVPGAFTSEVENETSSEKMLATSVSMQTQAGSILARDDVDSSSLEVRESSNRAEPQKSVSVSSEVSTVSDILDELEEEDQQEEVSELAKTGYHPLPRTYRLEFGSRGQFLQLVLPPAPKKSAILNKTNRKTKRNIQFNDKPLGVFETYSEQEYERGDDKLDPLTASAEYEIEKKTESLDKIKVTIEKDNHGLGLSIVGIGLTSDMGTEKLGIFVKGLTPNGAAVRCGQINVNDQILEVDGTSLVGVTQMFAAQTLKGTGKVVNFLLGREPELKYNQ